MNAELLMKLSDADAVASKEDEVRSILYEELHTYCDDISYDMLGSMIFHKKGAAKNPLKIMFCAHMDEVGFLVRHISDIGFVYLVALGGVLAKSKEMQKVNITTSQQKKIVGLLNITKDEKGNVKDMYVDVGCDTREEVEALGIEIGNMVCFASIAQQMSNRNVYMGKAMDDRSGCYVLAEALKQMQNETYENDIYMVATSSEEVGVRGGKLATYQVNPDIVFAIDVANNPELNKNYTNHRLIGKGCMLVHYDKTLAPNEKLLNFVKQCAKRNDLPYQCDMFGGGGTDAGNASLSRNGKLALVIGIPLRYCHGSYSLVHQDDLEHTIQLVKHLATDLTTEKYKSFIDFNGGK
ncbi:MAG: aminopeptidase [Longicatena sp.]